jgi:hypothetical protein
VVIDLTGFVSHCHVASQSISHQMDQKAGVKQPQPVDRLIAPMSRMDVSNTRPGAPIHTRCGKKKSDNTIAQRHAPQAVIEYVGPNAFVIPSDRFSQHGHRLERGRSCPFQPSYSRSSSSTSSRERWIW